MAAQIAIGRIRANLNMDVSLCDSGSRPPAEPANVVHSFTGEPANSTDLHRFTSGMGNGPARRLSVCPRDSAAADAAGVSSQQFRRSARRNMTAASAALRPVLSVLRLLWRNS